jgi:hypothetical protein
MPWATTPARPLGSLYTRVLSGGAAWFQAVWDSCQYMLGQRSLLLVVMASAGGVETVTAVLLLLLFCCAGPCCD